MGGGEGGGRLKERLGGGDGEGGGGGVLGNCEDTRRFQRMTVMGDILKTP